MREILFKAKAKDKPIEWIEGYLSKCEKEFIICDEEGFGIFIDPKTICQYTGLTDKNGNMIWENDIIRFNDGNECVVRWRYGAFEFLYRACANAIYAYVGTDLYLDDNTLDIEVIGNIFENPELINRTEL